MYSDSFVLRTKLIYKYEYNEYEYNIDNELIPFEICLIHIPTHSVTQLKKNTLNTYKMSMRDTNHSSKFTIVNFVVVPFTKKEERK